MEKKTILLVDDDHDFISAQTVLIKHLGYDVITAFNAVDGFEKAKSIHPDLIILDVNMETRNAGFDLNRQIRNDDSLKSIPIIMLTGIETYAITPQAIDMYNSMMAQGNVDLKEVLKVGSSNTSLGVQFRDDDGKPYYLALDSFVSKSHVESDLEPEIKRLIG